MHSLTALFVIMPVSELLQCNLNSLYNVPIKMFWGFRMFSLCLCSISNFWFCTYQCLDSVGQLLSFSSQGKVYIAFIIIYLIHGLQCLLEMQRVRLLHVWSGVTEVPVKLCWTKVRVQLVASPITGVCGSSQNPNPTEKLSSNKISFMIPLIVGLHM